MPVVGAAARSSVASGLGFAFAAALGYGVNVPFARLAALAGLPGTDVVFYRSFVLVALLSGIVWLKQTGFGVPRGGRGTVLGLGLASAGVAISYISSVAFIPVNVATIVYYVYPLLILVLSPFVDGERLTPARIVIFFVAFCGLFIAIGPSFSTLDPRGLALAGVAAIAACAQFFFAARATRAVDPAVAGLWVQGIIIPAALVVCLARGGFAPPAAVVAGAFPGAMTGGLFIVAFTLHLSAARLAPPAALGLIFCAEPVTSIVGASFLLGEALTMAQLVGGGLVLAAVLAAIVIESRKPGSAAIIAAVEVA